MPFEEFIPRYDRETTLFYLDPPYWGSEGDYGRQLFARDDFHRLAELLRGIRGRFVLSLNDHPEVRRIFAAFAIDAVDTTYTVARGAGKKVGELLISNRS